MTAVFTIARTIWGWSLFFDGLVVASANDPEGLQTLALKLGADAPPVPLCLN